MQNVFNTRNFILCHCIMSLFEKMNKILKTDVTLFIEVVFTRFLLPSPTSKLQIKQKLCVLVKDW